MRVEMHGMKQDVILKKLIMLNWWFWYYQISCTCDICFKGTLGVQD